MLLLKVLPSSLASSQNMRTVLLPSRIFDTFTIESIWVNLSLSIMRSMT